MSFRIDNITIETPYTPNISKITIDRLSLNALLYYC